MPRRRTNKTKLTLYVDKNVLERAKELIPNLSSFVELKLKEFVILSEHGLSDASRICGGWDLNPRTPSGVDLESTAFGLARQPPLV